MEAYLTEEEVQTLGTPLAAVIGGMPALLALGGDSLVAVLGLASNDVDRAMPYQGRKYAPLQVLEFPRIPYGSFTRRDQNMPVGAELALNSPALMVWDWDATNNVPIVPDAVKLACLLQGAWIMSADGKAATKRLEAIRSGLASQQIGTAQEAYNLAAATAGGGLCQRSGQIMATYALRSGSMM